ncbi:hypothetical protein RB608_07890 [Nocardioides sp. LHD-245]|uniref:hypothetical protein n=1 Tax=Nocardioides sp. LHD-245 TaxID=3051387 RepID=UPI0027DFC980|nr:hypothetical protein [Nocardioides sp. LHD-245]
MTLGDWASIITMIGVGVSVLVTISRRLDALRDELKGDIADLRAELKGDIADLRAELKGEDASIRRELALVRDELKGEVAALRAEVKTDIAALRDEVRTDIADLRTGLRQLHDKVDRHHEASGALIYDLNTRVTAALSPRTAESA